MIPKVSVCIPVYNVQEYIEQCAVSLFEQILKEMGFVFVEWFHRQQHGNTPPDTVKVSGMSDVGDHSETSGESEVGEMPEIPL